MGQQPFPLRDVQAAYWAGRTPALTLGNVAAYCYYEYEVPHLDLHRLDAALQCLVARHDALRLIVREHGLQEVLGDVPPYRIHVNDLSALGSAAADRALEQVRERLSHQVLPLDRWPLFVVEATLLPHRAPRFHFGFDLIMCDAASSRILLRELVELYTDCAASLPPIQSTFRDYVIAEQRLRTGDAYKRARQYWSERAHDLPPAPHLPFWRDPDAISTPRFAQVSRELDEAEWTAIKAAAARARITPTAALLAIYGESLSRYGDEQRFTLNLPIFSRLPVVPEVDRLIGDFTSLLPLAIDCTGSETLLARARQLQKQLWQGLDHRIASDVVMRERARRAGAHRDALLPYVFTSILGLEDAPRRERWPILQHPLIMVGQTPQVMLDFVLSESEGRLHYTWHFVEGLFHPETIDGLADSFSSRLHELPSVDVWHSVGGPAILTRDADHLRPPAPHEARPSARLEELFLESAERSPDAVAVLTAGRTLTYSELERRSARLAIEIRKAEPVHAGERLVAVVMPKGWEQVSAVLGILRAGAAYVPIHPQLPQARITELLRASGVTTVLTRSDVDPWLEWPAGITRILADSTVPVSGAEIPDVQRMSSDSLAYVIYTSGSTGVPKGVTIPHRGAVNTILEINRMCAVGPPDRVLAVSSLSFDLSVYDIFGPLAAGAAVVMPDTGRDLSVEHWFALMQSAGVTVWNSVPALLQLLLERAGSVAPFARMRLAMVSGDWIPLTLPGMLRDAAPDAKFLAMGGATEASIWSIYKWVDEIAPQWASIPYGRPLPNQSVYVLDSRLNPCPTWTPGELYIGGVGVALGYFNDPERTAANFVVHHDTGERLYRTGDFGRYLPDGEIEFLGRRDSQVKIFGHRIELGEIESVLLRHSLVQQCAVVAVGETRRLTGLVAYVVPSGDARPASDALRVFAAAHLPPHMVPRDILVVETLPLTSNGKVDRKALIERAAVPPPVRPYVPPRSDVESTVAGFWMEVLQVDRIGIHDDFFELGGDSLAATRVISRVNSAFGCSKSIRAVFDQPTIAEFCGDLAAVANA